MKPKDHRLRVGLTLTIFATLLFVLVFSLDSARAVWKETRRIEVEFEQVYGLRPNDPVHFHGIPCGRVVELAVTSGAGRDQTAFAAGPEDQPIRVLVSLEVPGEYYDLLLSGSLARIEKTLTGVTVVNLARGSGTQLESGQQLVGVETTTFAAVATELKSATSRLKTILSEVEPLVREIREEDLITGAIAELRGTSQKASELVEQVTEITRENREGIHELIASAKITLKSLDGILPDVAATAASAAEVVDKGSTMVDSARAWLADTRFKLTKTIDDLTTTARSVKTLTSDVKRRPWRLLYRPRTRELEEIDGFENRSAYVEASAQIYQSIQELKYLLETDIDEVTRERFTQLLGSLEDSWKRFQDYELDQIRKLSE